MKKSQNPKATAKAPNCSTLHLVLAGRKNMAHTPKSQKRQAQKARKDMEQW